MMLSRRLEILPDGEKIDIGAAQVVHQLDHLVPLLAQTHHDARLREHRRIDLLDLLQQPKGGEIARTWAHGQVKRRHRLEVVIEHIRPRSTTILDRPSLRRKSGVRTSIVVPGLRVRIARITSAKCCAPPSDRSSRSTDVMTTWERPSEPPPRQHFSGSSTVERAGQAGLDVAERTGAGAGIAHDHEGGVLLLPALADIRTARFLANRVQAALAHDPARLGIAGRGRRLDANPVGLALRPANPAGAPFQDGAARATVSTTTTMGEPCGPPARRPCPHQVQSRAPLWEALARQPVNARPPTGRGKDRG